MGTEASAPAPKRRVLAVLPIPYTDGGGFWNRDVGLAMRKMHDAGHDAWLVAVKIPGEDNGTPYPVILGTWEELADPAWWRSQAPDAVLLNTWSAPRHEGIRRAVLALGVPVIEKLDTDGVKSPRIWLGSYTVSHLVGYAYGDSFLHKLGVWIKALARTVVVYSFPALLDARMVKGMSTVPVFAAESPLATARVKRFLRLFHASPMPEVVTIPHPVNTEKLSWRPGDRKENVIVAVGRWGEAVKGWPLLLEMARRFLPLYPDWKIVVIGAKPLLSARDEQDLAAWQGRLHLVGHLDHAELSGWYRRAKIYLLPSVCETFNIAAAEALCCGCSVVGPAQIASMAAFTGHASGTSSFRRTPDHMTDALIAEIDEWQTGHRDPDAIARASLKAWSVETVCAAYLDTFRKIELRASKGI
jgi:glycosyltransferase involved in cell wall biosynthesis